MSSLKLLPIGGIGGVTKNLYVYEYNKKILIVDCGIGFPTTNMPGIDILIPDISYLKEKSDQILGMLLTHAHDDHIAALPYVLPQLPDFPIFGSNLTIGFAQDRLKESKIKADFREFPDDKVLEIGPFKVESIKVTHSVPDCRHFAIHTPEGIIYHGSDFKFDLTPVDGVVSDYNKIARIGDEGVLCLLSDCLRSEKPGHSLSESIITDSFEREIKGVKGKFIITSMSSNVHRIQQAIDVALAHDRKIAFIGRSIEQNIKTATRLGFFKVPQKATINKRKINSYPPEKLCVIIAGSQGQPESSLSRAALGEHPYIRINPEDKVVFSSDPIPGNEDSVYAAIDNISRIGADVSYSDVDDNLHVSGHASALEQKLLVALTKPKYFVPIGGTYRHMVQYQKLVDSMGYSPKSVFLLQDGETLQFSNKKVQYGSKLKLKQVMVDGTGVGDVGSIVLSDRETMADSGMLVIVIPVDDQGNVINKIEIISRGFVFMKRSQELISRIEDAVIDTLNKHKNSSSDWKKLRRHIESDISDLVYLETERQPLILPVMFSSK